ncbi:MAG: polysaccharide deacetylase family protein [Treponema sp.]|jgi:peptidoglycan/xylan/chitin deacetylase (PgdA/CDA1 family)|nr:polysaccharide deacetylase family protein [Treponema sp.]
MKNNKIILLPVIFTFFISGLPAFNFHDLNLSGDNRLLFNAGFQSQDALFIARMEDLSLRQLTAFPEKLILLENGRTILAVNHFGAFKIPSTGGIPEPLKGIPSFAEGNVPLKGRTQELNASADGRWFLYVEPVSPAYGNLLLVEISSGAKRIISEKVELPSVDFPACWSPDSRLFVYSKGGSLYYFPMVSDPDVIVNERFRQIGPGRINSVLWGQQGDFFYLLGNTLYRVLSPELFTRTIYGDFLSIGSVAATIPFEFEPGFDRYWIAPDSGSILINKRGKSVFFFQLGENQYSSASLPHIMIPQGMGNISVFWSSSGLLSIISSMQKETAVWRFQINGKQINSLSVNNAPVPANGLLSPDGTKILFWENNDFELWDYANWQLIYKLSGGPVFSCVWINSRQFIAGSARFIENINITDSGVRRARICLSNTDEAGFENSQSAAPRILARSGTEWFATDGRNPWIPAVNPQLRNVQLFSDRYRVYLETQSSGPFKNILMVRNTASTGTVSIVANHSVSAVYPSGQQMSVALCFDLYDDDSGLSAVLNNLNAFGKKTTFFLNGDFIRRSPHAASAIAQAGHETASLFYAPVDFSDSRYRVTHDFIVQGLARNEDEFYRATGKELSLLWHPPFFRSSREISSAAAAAGYTTVSRDIDPGDWLSAEESVRLNIRKMSVSEIIEQIIQRKKHGAVIPVRLGLIPGGRDEYLYQRIDVLFDALVRSGCEIVPVSSVKE